MQMARPTRPESVRTQTDPIRFGSHLKSTQLGLGSISTCCGPRTMAQAHVRSAQWAGSKPNRLMGSSPSSDPFSRSQAHQAVGLDPFTPRPSPTGWVVHGWRPDPGPCPDPRSRISPSQAGEHDLAGGGDRARLRSSPGSHCDRRIAEVTM